MNSKTNIARFCSMVLMGIIFIACSGESPTEEKNKAVKAPKAEGQSTSIDISALPPGGFEGDPNTAKFNANKFYTKATRFWDMNSSRYRKPDSVIFYAATSNYFSPSCASTSLMGQVYVQKGEIKKGLEYYNKAIELDSTQGEPFFNRGTAYYIMGNLPAACESWKKANAMGVPNAAAALGMYCR